MIRLQEKDEEDIVRGYNNLETMISLSKKYGITRQGIYKVLKRHGVDTSKRKLDVKCDTCQKVFKRHKYRMRKQLHNFCCNECYFAFLESGNGVGKYKESRWGQKIARKKVSKVFSLKRDHVVHHEDRNCHHNELYNLKVFKCQGDHVKYHRGINVSPVFSG